MNRESERKNRGIPHLAKYKRDVGHPSLVRGREAFVLFLLGSVKSPGRSPTVAFCPLAQRCNPLKAFEKIIFGPGTLGRTWGTVRCSREPHEIDPHGPGFVSGHDFSRAVQQNARSSLCLTR